MQVDRYGEMYGTVEEFDFLEALGNLIEDTDGKFDGAYARSYDETGTLTNNVGMTVRFGDGREFQVTVVQSGGKRTDVDDDDDD